MRGILAVMLLAFMIVPASSNVLAAPAPHAMGKIQLTFLGNAGWSITDGQTVIVVDPFLSYFDVCGTKPLQDCTSPEGAAEKPEFARERTNNERVPRADYILITHGHLDHALDGPYIAKKTGAAIIGHETVANIARAYDVPEQQLITVRGGEDFEFGSFSLRVIPSIHSALRNKRYNNGTGAGTVPRGTRGPLLASQFAEGGTLAYLLRLGRHQILIMGGMNYIEREMEGLRPDIALIGANRNRREIHDYTSRLMRTLSYPKVVFPTHVDPRDPEISAFISEVKAASPTTRAIAPQWFQTWTF